MSKAKTFIIIFLLLLIGAFIMTGIVHKVVKSSGEKGLATEWNDDHEITGNVDVNQNQFLNNVIENRTDFPAGPVAGQVIYRTDLKITYIFDGTNWSLLNKSVNYWSCSGVNFVPNSPNAFVYYYEIGEGELKITTTGGDEVVMAPVFLPHGAVVTGAIVRGSAGGNSWWLTRMPLNSVGASQDLATANINVEDNTIANATIDNTAYHYYFVADAQNGNLIYGARITYTL